MLLNLFFNLLELQSALSSLAFRAVSCNHLGYVNATTEIEFSCFTQAYLLLPVVVFGSYSLRGSSTFVQPELRVDNEDLTFFSIFLVKNY